MTCKTFDCYSGDKNMTPSKSYRSLITIVSNFPRISKDRESHVKMKLKEEGYLLKTLYASYYFLELKILALFQRYSKCEENTSKTEIQVCRFSQNWIFTLKAQSQNKNFSLMSKSWTFDKNKLKFKSQKTSLRSWPSVDVYLWLHGREWTVGTMRPGRRYTGRNPTRQLAKSKGMSPFPLPVYQWRWSLPVVGRRLWSIEEKKKNIMMHFSTLGPVRCYLGFKTLVSQWLKIWKNVSFFMIDILKKCRGSWGHSRPLRSFN